jgi:hypothetical protein
MHTYCVLRAMVIMGVKRVVDRNSINTFLTSGKQIVDRAFSEQKVTICY